MLLLPPFPSDATANAWRDVVKTLPEEPTLRFAASERPPPEPAAAARATAVRASPSICAGGEAAYGVRDGQLDRQEAIRTSLTSSWKEERAFVSSEVLDSTAAQQTLHIQESTAAAAHAIDRWYVLTSKARNVSCTGCWLSASKAVEVRLHAAATGVSHVSA